MRLMTGSRRPHLLPTPTFWNSNKNSKNPNVVPPIAEGYPTTGQAVRPKYTTASNKFGATRNKVPSRLRAQPSILPNKTRAKYADSRDLHPCYRETQGPYAAQLLLSVFHGFAWLLFPYCGISTVRRRLSHVDNSITYVAFGWKWSFNIYQCICSVNRSSGII